MMNRLFILLLAASCLTAVGQYQVGDVGPAGGWIFYVDTEEQFEEWDYLEVWPHTFSFFQLLACDYSPYLSSSEMGTGKNNTTVFASNNGTFSAFDFAVLFDGGGRSDWFLPSKSELEAISASTVSALINSGQGYSAASSSVFNECQWWTYDSNNGWGIQNDLYSWLWVLPIRSFQTADEGSVCDWQPDGNGDNLIGVNDLLDLLGVYGDTDYDQDGIWDSADDCVGEYDECGLCNGSGPSIPIIESIEILYDSVYAEQIDEWFVFEVGVDTTYQYVCELILGCTDPAAANFSATATVDNGDCCFGWCCGLDITYSGETYSTIEIGDDCWFREDLRTYTYRDGTPIPFTQDDNDWSVFSCNAEMCANVWFGPTNEDGVYYSSAVARGVTNDVCPQGWHVSTLGDWQNLILNLELEGGYTTPDLSAISLEPKGSINGGNIVTNTAGFERSYHWTSESCGSTMDCGSWTGWVPIGVSDPLGSWDLFGPCAAAVNNGGMPIRCIKD